MSYENNHNETALLARLSAGDASAFTVLYRQHSGSMYMTILRMVKSEELAEELVQEIFTHIWHKKETLRIEQGFRAYLYKAAQNKVCDFYRKLQRDRLLYEQFKAIAAQDYTHIEEGLQLKKSNEVLLKALDTLPVQQRKVYQLCKMEGHSYKEAGLQLGISHHTVKEYLVKANHSIRAYVSGHFDTILRLMLLVAASQLS